jgi:hypothetical protein
LCKVSGINDYIEEYCDATGNNAHKALAAVHSLIPLSRAYVQDIMQTHNVNSVDLTQLAEDMGVDGGFAACISWQHSPEVEYDEDEDDE